MNKKFVVGISALSDDQKKELLKYFRANGWGWWHWIRDLWLVDSDDDFGPEKIRDHIGKIAPGSDVVVLEVSPITWATRGPEKKGRSFSRWLEEFWNEDE